MIEHVDADYVATEVRMTRAKSSGAVLVVEGDTDYGLLKHFAAEGCELVVAHGKENAVKALELLRNEDFEGVLAIVDADFDHIDDRCPQDPDIIVTDHHDIEMLILLSPALDRVLVELASKEKISRFLARRGRNSVIQCLLEEGEKFAELRYASKAHGWALRFRCVDFSKFVDGRSLVLDQEAAIERVLRNTRGPKVTATQVRHALDDFDWPERTPEHFCSGHDCTHLLALGLRQCLGTQTAAIACRTHVEKLLRLALDGAELVGSSLLAAVRAWEAQNTTFPVLRRLPGE